MKAETITRREFLSTSIRDTATLAAALPFVAAVPNLRAGSDAKVVLGLIGAGGRGTDLALKFQQVPGVEFKAVCDVSLPRAEATAKQLAAKQGTPPLAAQDLRRLLEDKDIHAVVVATPEHWHALATVWACQAGKDVYVEKNASLTLWESRKMIEAARKHDRVVQVGFQNRSAPYALSARDYLASGKLGRIVLVKVFNLLDGGAWKPHPDGPTPPGLDWDMWLGPAPAIPYNAGHQLGWNDWWAYAGGPFSGDASHQLDLTRLALGDPPHPKSVYSAGGRFGFSDGREMPDTLAVTYDYGDFVMTCESGNVMPYMRKFPNEVRYGDQWPYWPQSSCRVEIYGTKQLMYLGRHGCGWQVVEANGKVVAQDKGYFPDKWHQPNFIECVRSRKRPNADIEVVFPSAALIHLGIAAYRAGRKQLEFDSKAERFTNNEAANALLKPQFRGDYRIPETI